MSDTLSRAREFMLTHARLLERRLFEVQFAGADPSSVSQAVRAYQNADGGLGHALEPDLRCPESQPLFMEMGVMALSKDYRHYRALAGQLGKQERSFCGHRSGREHRRVNR